MVTPALSTAGLSANTPPGHFTGRGSGYSLSGQIAHGTGLVRHGEHLDAATPQVQLGDLGRADLSTTAQRCCAA
jgi:hypothetical protein